jgi:hypothetical protein
MANTVAIDMTDYGYEGQYVTIREPTGADHRLVKKFLNDSKKRSADGEADDFGASLYLLSKVIIEAPFDTTPQTLEQVPLRIINLISKKVQELTLPLVKKDEKQSSQPIEPEV